MIRRKEVKRLSGIGSAFIFCKSRLWFWFRNCKRKKRKC